MFVACELRTTIISSDPTHIAVDATETLTVAFFTESDGFSWIRTVAFCAFSSHIQQLAIEPEVLCPFCLPSMWSGRLHYIEKLSAHRSPPHTFEHPCLLSTRPLATARIPAHGMNFDSSDHFPDMETNGGGQ